MTVWVEKNGLLVPAAEPTRAEQIKSAWREVRSDFADADFLVAVDDSGEDPPIRFERVHYAVVTVIEAEGVIVERL